jgi:hypothetical protein
MSSAWNSQDMDRLTPRPRSIHVYYANFSR